MVSIGMRWKWVPLSLVWERMMIPARGMERTISITPVNILMNGPVLFVDKTEKRRILKIT
jgi:hypothetical protein